VYQLRVHEVEELLDIWHGLQQSAVDSAIRGERAFVPAYKPNEDILSSGNMVIESAVIEKAVFQIRIMCFPIRLTIDKLMIYVWHSFVIKNWQSNW